MKISILFVLSLIVPNFAMAAVDCTQQAEKAAVEQFNKDMSIDFYSDSAFDVITESKADRGGNQIYESQFFSPEEPDFFQSYTVEVDAANNCTPLSVKPN